MSEGKKTLLSKTEVLLQSISDKLDKLLDIEQQHLDIFIASQQLQFSMITLDEYGKIITPMEKKAGKK